MHYELKFKVFIFLKDINIFEFRPDTLHVEVNKDHKIRMSKVCLCKEVSLHCLCIGRVKGRQRSRKLYSTKRESSDMPWLEAVSLGKTVRGDKCKRNTLCALLEEANIWLSPLGPMLSGEAKIVEAAIINLVLDIWSCYRGYCLAS